MVKSLTKTFFIKNTKRISYKTSFYIKGYTMPMAQIVHIRSFKSFISPGSQYLKISFVVCLNIKISRT